MTLQIAALRDAYRVGRSSPAAVTEEVLRRVAEYPDKAVWISLVPPEQVRARAAALAAEPGGVERLPLYGIPFAVKDNIDVAGMETTAACPAYAYPAQATATAVQRLLDAGAVLIGKTNMDQFATGLVGTRSPYGAPRCVFDPAHVSGGSSSGSAVAVAAGLVSFALGTDTAGSGRVPAAFNNLVGWKPSRGLIPATGVVPACRSLDCVTVFASSVSEARQVAAVAEGVDEADPFSRPNRPVPLPEQGFRIAVLRPEDRVFGGDEEAALYDAAVARMEARGAAAVPFDYAPFREVAQLLYGGPYVAERLAAIAEFFTSHEADMDPTVRGIIGGARRFTAADAFEGQYRLAALAKAAGRAWAGFDAMLLPTSPTIVTVEEVAADPVGRNSLLGTYTNFVNLLDLAAVAVPAGFTRRGLPFGVTLIGPAFSDHAVAVWADRLHRDLGEGVGCAREPIAAPALAAPPAAGLEIAVVGAHLSGMPLNGQLTSRGAALLRRTRTAPDYALYALPGTVPAKPGLVRRPGLEGPGIEVEVWRLPPDGFGSFVAEIPAPLGVGRVTLAEGDEMSCFLCEAHAIEGAEDITALGGWRSYLARRSAG